MIGLQPLERLVDLTGGRGFGATVELRHQEHSLAIPVAQRVPHAALALAVVIVPAVVEEGDAAIDRRSDDADALGRILRPADVMAAEADGRDLLAGSSQDSIDHVSRLRTGRLVALGFACGPCQRDRC